MVASEALPYAKSGGLADVVAGLPRALVTLGHQVDVVIPRYRGVDAPPTSSRLAVPLGGEVLDAGIAEDVRDGVRTILIDYPPYFDRDFLYGTAGQDYADNAERFAFLAQAALTWAFSSHQTYDVIHAHDWQAGLVPVLLGRMVREQSGLRRIPVVFTIHNLAYQGIFDASWLLRLGLGWDLMHVDSMEYWGRISYLKAGIVFSRVVTTVSPKYAREIQTPEYGAGFDGILRARGADLVGILNGIDYDHWDPARDPNLPEPFSASNLKGKAAAKRRLLERYGLPFDAAAQRQPVAAMISRMVDQKGLDLLAGLADELPRLPMRIVVLGTGERRYEDMWLGLASRHPDRIGVRVGFDEGLAHLIEGGADLFLMPSRFEPCGLNQMYSLRYGTVPVVRATGGLFDTVQNYDPGTSRGTGFTFEEYSPQALLGTLRWALQTFENRTAWTALQHAGMRKDFSWAASARSYEAVYQQAVTV